MTIFKRLTRNAAGLLLGAGAQLHGQGRAAALPAVPTVHGALRIVVAYPTPGSALVFGDSTFMFGRVGDGRATLTIAGRSVAVAENGAWLAWLAMPRDSAFSVTLHAVRGSDSASSVVHYSRADWVRETGTWIDPASRSPIGSIWLPRDEPLPLTVRAAPGAQVRLLLGGGRAIRFAPDNIAGQPLAGVRNFDRDPRNLRRSATGDRYVAVLRTELAPGYDGLIAPTQGFAAREPVPPMLEVSLRGKVTRMPWPIRVTRSKAPPVAVVLDDDTLRAGGTDRSTIGRAFPTGTYTWFLPQGTRAHADMRMDDQVRLRLARGAVAWVPAADVHLASAVDDARPAIMGSPTLTALDGRTELRIPLTRPVPHSVSEGDRSVAITLYDAVSDANWTRYGAEQRFVQLLTWKQDEDDRLTLTVKFDRALWGWRVRVDGTDLVFDFRAPPVVDAERPLRGRRIVVDPGHPPGGACGPTGLCEPEANLAVANAVREQLVAAGATVIMTRTGSGDVGLWPRVAFADSVDAELLVSIHNNALPDGVNPFTNNGTTTFFNHPHSVALADAVQARLVANVGLRDLGVARGDLALTRPTWYPAILTEGLFMMVPAQEAALRSGEGQRRYATGVVEGIVAFFRGLADAARPQP